MIAREQEPADPHAFWLARIEERFAATGKLFNSIAYAREHARAHVVCLGDSHLRVLREEVHPANAAHQMPHAWFDPCPVVGATARGLANPFSRTNALNIFRRRIELAEPWQPIVFQLGEVDCGFLIWYRAEKLGEPIDEQFERIVETYLAFMQEVRAQGFERQFVLSAPAPTIKHAKDWAGPTHPRQQIDVSQRDRTDLTLRYNDELARRADDYTFVDVTRPTLDPATGLVAKEFVNADKRDHHLSPEPYGRVIAERLGPHLHPP